MDRNVLQKYLNAAQEAALAGGHQLQIDFGRVRNIREKGRRDPITQSDYNAEQCILQILKQHFPDHRFLAEETANRASGTAPFEWIIDPLDGTMNYIHGIAQFGVSIALQYHATTIIGVVYQPLAHDMYTAMIGHGAFLNGNRLRVSQINTLDQSLVGTGFSASLSMREKQLAGFAKVLQVCAAIREPGSAALGLCDVARGAYESYWELGLMPWDVAAGALLVTEAGGMVTNVVVDSHNLSDVHIVASNGFIHHELMEFLDIHAKT